MSSSPVSIVFLIIAAVVIVGGLAATIYFWRGD